MRASSARLWEAIKSPPCKNEVFPEPENLLPSLQGLLVLLRHPTNIDLNHLCGNQQLLIIYVFPGGGNFSRSELNKYSEEPDRTEQSQSQLAEHLFSLLMQLHPDLLLEGG